MDNSNCAICVEKFNKNIHREIKCEYCDFIACRSCFETYLLSQPIPHCMKSNEECGKVWTRKFMANNFTINFLTKKYKFHQEQILFEKELALMPETQLKIEKQMSNNRKIEKYTHEINELNHLVDELCKNRRHLEELRLNVDVVNRNVFTQRYVDEDTESEDEDEEEVEQVGDGDGEETKGEETKTKRKYKNKNRPVHKCSNENCRGFLSPKWDCNLCSTWTCKSCRVNIGTIETKQTHICNKDDLDTANLLKNDSKPCPKCSVLIYKINGCDQMYCTQCHTPFSWNTGLIETGNIHNPHYYEYLKMSGIAVPRNPLDIVGVNCNRNLGHEFTNNFRASLRYLSDSSFKNFNRMNDTGSLLLDICRNINHMSYMVISNISFENNSYDRIKEFNRVKYLRNEISEEEFKRTVQINEKRYQKNTELVNLYTMIRDTITDRFNEINEKLEEVAQIMDNWHEFKLDELIIKLKEELNKRNICELNVTLELTNLQSYANECLANISKTYNSTHKAFANNFELVSVNKIKMNKLKATVTDLTEDMI